MTEFLSPHLAQASGAGSALNFLLLPLLLGGLFFVLIRPQRKRQKELQQLREQIGVGDEVMTSSGIYGFITGEEDDLYWLEIDQDVQIRISKAAIHSRVPDPSETAEVSEKSSDKSSTGHAEKKSKSASAAQSAAKGTSKAGAKKSKNATADRDSDDASEAESIEAEAES